MRCGWCECVRDLYVYMCMYTYTHKKHNPYLFGMPSATHAQCSLRVKGRLPPSLSVRNRMISPLRLGSQPSGNECVFFFPVLSLRTTTVTSSEMIAPTIVGFAPRKEPSLRWSATISSLLPLARRITHATGLLGAAIHALMVANADAVSIFAFYGFLARFCGGILKKMNEVHFFQKILL